MQKMIRRCKKWDKAVRFARGEANNIIESVRKMIQLDITSEGKVQKMIQFPKGA